MMPIRIVTWNCRRAGATHAAWDYLREQNADLILLQEVTGIPEWVQSEYDIRVATPPTKADHAQRFQSALLVRGRIGSRIVLSSPISWVSEELRRFAPNFLAYEIELGEFRINAMCVYAPAWPVSRSRLEGLDVSEVKLVQNPDVWVADLLVNALRGVPDINQPPWVVAGDFNSCETFDSWKGGPRGNREWLDRMAALGFVEVLRHSQGALTPTFRRPGKEHAHCQIDHLFASAHLAKRLVGARTGPVDRIYAGNLSDHLPIVSDFATSPA
jgi:endonuclease/exonuclease/phosphatase family metal-dependent hydrolase